MKILMIGLGGIGQRHIRNLRSLLGDELEIIAFRHLNRSQVLTDQLKIEPGVDLVDKYNITTYPNLEQALAQKPDVVFVCSPTSLHIPVATQVAHAGYNLFIEKPLSHDLVGVEELIRLIEQKRLKAVVGYQMRFHPCLTHLYFLIQQKVIGKIISVRAEVGDYMPAWHSYEDYRQLYASQEKLGGGVVLTQIHELDYLLWLFGMPRSVFAVGGHLSSLDINVEDTADILMECFVDGQILPVSVHMDFVQLPSTRSCVVVGDKGKILVDIKALSINVFDSTGELIDSIVYDGYDRNQPFIDELKCFLNSSNGNQKPLVQINEAVQSLKIALAVKESLRTGELVKLGYGN